MSKGDGSHYRIRSTVLSSSEYLAYQEILRSFSTLSVWRCFEFLVVQHPDFATPSSSESVSSSRGRFAESLIQFVIRLRFLSISSLTEDVGCWTIVLVLGVKTSKVSVFLMCCFLMVFGVLGKPCRDGLFVVELLAGGAAARLLE